LRLIALRLALFAVALPLLIPVALLADRRCESKRRRRSTAESHDERDSDRGEEVVPPGVTEEVSGHGKLIRSIHMRP